MIELPDHLVAESIAIRLDALLVGFERRSVELLHELLAHERAFAEQPLVVAVEFVKLTLLSCHDIWCRTSRRQTPAIAEHVGTMAEVVEELSQRHRAAEDRLDFLRADIDIGNHRLARSHVRHFLAALHLLECAGR